MLNDGEIADILSWYSGPMKNEIALRFAGQLRNQAERNGAEFDAEQFFDRAGMTKQDVETYVWTLERRN